MSQTQIAVIVGSLRKDSINRKLAQALATLAPADFTLKIVEIGDLPLYNQDDDAQQAASVLRMKAEIAAAQAQTELARQRALQQAAEITGYPSVEDYLRAKAIEAGQNPYQPTYVVPQAG